MTIDEHVQTLELKLAERDVTIRELEEQIRALHAEAAAHANASAQAQADLAARHSAPDLDVVALGAVMVEHRLRERDVCEVRLWGAPWFGVLTRDAYSVTLTLRNGAGEVHGSTLADALDRLEERVGKVER